MRLRRAGSALLPLLAAAACGGGLDVPEVRVRDPGQGSGTLLVEAWVKGEAVVPNATDASGFRTRILARVSRRGGPVVDADVRVNGLPLAHRGAGVYGEPSQLLGLPAGVVAVEARAGDDWAQGAISSPGGHAFTRPSRSGEVLSWDAGTPLRLEWIRGARADSASLDVGGFAATGDLDDGTWAAPPGAAGLGPAASAGCGLWRENRVLLRGAATGSFLSVSVWNGLRVTLDPR